jgi:HlyD family secretion protein
MDRAIQKRSGVSTRAVVLTGFSVLTLALAYQLIAGSGESRLRVDPTRMTTAQIAMGEFREYFPFDGRVEPETTVFLDIEEGGRVEEILVEGGQYVEAGQLILRFSNAALQRSSIDTETRLVENLNALRNTQINLAQNALLLKDQLLDLDYQIFDLEQTFARYSTLRESDAVSVEVFERARDELVYRREKRDLLAERIDQEDRLSQLQLAQANSSIERLNVMLDLVSQIIESLEVRAPISGYQDRSAGDRRRRHRDPRRCP